MKRTPFLLAAIPFLIAVCLLASAAADAQAFSVIRVASGLDRPVFLTSPPHELSRGFVVEQQLGQIRIVRLKSRTLDATPFLTVPGVSTGNEQGLLGLAFDPDYATNGFFYVNYTDPDTHIVRYHVSSNRDVADPASATPVLTISQPQSNHNGGWTAFGPDGYLYISTGDGGGDDDNDSGHTADTGNAQDITDNLLGKILRIDPSGDAFPGDPERNYAIPPDNPFVGVTGDDEIWVYGLRNPWRNGFDRATGDLYIGDVGQTRCEEVNVQPGTSAGGENYGWRLREGTIATPTGGVGGAAPAGAIGPIMDYPHNSGQCTAPGAGFTGIAVTGGFVYRGPVAALRGRYFFGDYGTGNLWSLVFDGSDPADFDGHNYTGLTDHSTDPAYNPNTGAIDSISSFGEDEAGNLYVLDLNGEVFYLPEPSALSMQLSGVLATFALARHRSRGRSTHA